MEQNKSKIAVWSNTPLLEKLFHGHNLHLLVNFEKYNTSNSVDYILVLIDLSGDLTEVSQKIISIYEKCRENKQKLAVVLLHQDNIDTEKNIYFTTLLEGLSDEKPLYRLVIVKDLYQTSLVDPVTWFDSFLLKIINARKIDITSKGVNEYFPLSIHDFINGILKIFFLAGTAGKTFWLIGETITDLDLAYLIKKKLENVDDQEFEINADSPNIIPGLHLRSLGNQTAAALNWENEDDFYEAMTDIARRLYRDQNELEKNMGESKERKNKLSWIYLDLITKIEKLQNRLFHRKIKISGKKIQYIYLNKLIEGVIFFVVISYFLITASFFGFTNLSLSNAEKSIIDLRKGDIVSSVKSQKNAQIYADIGESSYGFISPVINLLVPGANNKNLNLFTFQNYILSSIGNLQQTYFLAEKIYKGFSGPSIGIKHEEASLALKSNLSQVYENLNQIDLLSQPGKLPQIVEAKIRDNNEFKNIKTVEQQIINLIKAVDLIPSALGGDSARNTVILFQNNQELHSTGGRLDYVLVLVTDHGKIVSHKIYSSAEIDSLNTEPIQPPPLLKEIFGQDKWKFQDFNYNPDYPQTAANISWFIEKTLKFKPDVIMAVNNLLIEDLLSEEKNFSLNGQSITPESLRLSTGLTLDLYKELINFFTEKFVQGNLPLLSVGRVVAKEIGQNQILYWSADELSQSSILDQAYSGAILDFRCHAGLYNVAECISQTSYLNETAVSVSGSLNSYERKEMHKIFFTADKIDHEYDLDYKLNSGENKTDSQNVKIFQLYITSPSELKLVIVDGQPVATPGLIKQTESKLDRYQIPLVFNEDKERQIIIKFSTQLSSNLAYPLGYSLSEYHQPGLGSMSSTLEANYPSTLKPSTITSSADLGPNKFTYIFPPKTATFGVSFVPNQP